MGFDYRVGYEYELAHRENLRGALGTPVTVVSVLGAALGTMFSSLRDGTPVGFEVIVFWILFAVALTLLVKTVYHLARSLHGHTYKAIESPSRLRAHHEALRDWHEKYGDGRLRGDREFDEYLESKYADATEHNQRINDYRSDQLFLGQRWMIFTAIVTGLAAMAFVANQQLRDKTPERLILVPETHANRSVPTMANPNTSPPPPKPTPPPLRDIREGHIPRPTSPTPRP
jgi:hypothetical protein